MKRLTLILAASLLGGCVTTMKSERDLVGRSLGGGVGLVLLGLV